MQRRRVCAPVLDQGGREPLERLRHLERAVVDLLVDDVQEADAVLEEVDRVRHSLGRPRRQVRHHVANVRRVLVRASVLHPVGDHPCRHAAAPSNDPDPTGPEDCVAGSGTTPRLAGRARPAAAPRADSAAAASTAAAEAVDEVGRAREPAVRPEDRHGDRDPQHAAELAHRGVDARGRCDIAIGDRRDDGTLTARDRERHPEPADDERAEGVEVGQVGSHRHREPDHRGRLDGEPGREQRPLADPVGQRAGHRCAHEERAGPGHQPDAGSEGRLAHHHL